MTTPFLGMMINVGFSFAPRGYATCNGNLQSIAQNTALYSLLGTTYGGDGQSTFGIPDLRSRIAIHRGQAAGTSVYTLGQIGGTENVSILTNNLPSHTHVATFSGSGTLNASNTRGGSATPTADALLGRGSDGADMPNSIPWIYVPATTSNLVSLAGVNVAGTVATGVTGAGVPVSTLQPFNTIHTIIALEGIFPSRN